MNKINYLKIDEIEFTAFLLKFYDYQESQLSTILTCFIIVSFSR